MKYQEKMNRYEKKQLQSKIMKEALAGEGVYLYENNSDADLTLPRPTKSGRREIGAREQFQGDDYYMQLVRTGFLKLIKELQSPTPAVPPQPTIEEQQSEVAMTEQKDEKLILDQPDTITNEGTVENVTQPQQCDKGTDCCGGTGHGQQPEVLLNEAPVDDDDSFVIVED